MSLTTTPFRTDDLAGIYQALPGEVNYSPGVCRTVRFNTQTGLFYSFDDPTVDSSVWEELVIAWRIFDEDKKGTGRIECAELFYIRNKEIYRLLLKGKNSVRSFHNSFGQLDYLDYPLNENRVGRTVHNTILRIEPRTFYKNDRQMTPFYLPNLRFIRMAEPLEVERRRQVCRGGGIYCAESRPFSMNDMRYRSYSETYRLPENVEI